MKKNIYKLAVTGLMTAAAVILPLALHAVPNAGRVLLPMHIPVLLCGLLCGWPYGLAAGIMSPLISALSTGAPPLYPVGLSMMLELAAYGAVAGMLKGKKLYISLPAAMLAGRAVMGAANVFLYGVKGENAYTFGAFIGGAFATALPGIAIQIVLIPVIMFALNRMNLTGKLYDGR